MTTNPEPPIDVEGFRATMRAAGIEEVVGEALETFVAESRVRFAHLTTAIASENIDAIRASAHALKSSSGNVHAHRMASLLHELEKAAETADMKTVTELFDRVAPAYEATMAHLEETDIDP